MKITFPTTKKLITQKQVSKDFNEINILYTIDAPEQKVVTTFTKELGELLVWEGAEYDNAGQWTDSDLLNKVNQIINSLTI